MKIKQLLLTKKGIIISILIIIGIITIGIVVFTFLKTNDENIEYLITFDVNGGSEVENIVAKKNDIVTLPQSEKENYYFNGWILNDKVVPTEYMVTDNVTLIASWIEEDIETFIVHFDTNGGNKIADVRIIKGEVINLPDNPKKEGYVFSHWQDENETMIYNNALLEVENEITLYAVWEAKNNNINIGNNQTQNNQQENNDETNNEKNNNEVNNNNTSSSNNNNNNNNNQTTSKKTYYCKDNTFTLKNDVCIKEEFVDKQEVSYCPDGSNEYSGICYVSAEINYSCEKGTLKYDGGFYYCFGEERTNITMDECQEYRELGWDAAYDSNTKTCYEYVINSIMTCPEGYHLSNSTRRVCEKRVEKVPKYICPNGYNEYINDSKKCVKTITQPADIK